MPKDEDTNSGTHPDMVMQDDISPLEIPTPEDAYRLSMYSMEVASGYFSQTNSFNDHAQFSMAKAMVWARLANVSSFGSVLLEHGPTWTGFNEDGPTSEEEDGRP